MARTRDGRAAGDRPPVRPRPRAHPPLSDASLHRRIAPAPDAPHSTERSRPVGAAREHSGHRRRRAGRAAAAHIATVERRKRSARPRRDRRDECEHDTSGARRDRQRASRKSAGSRRDGEHGHLDPRSVSRARRSGSLARDATHAWRDCRGLALPGWHTRFHRHRDDSGTHRCSARARALERDRPNGDSRTIRRGADDRTRGVVCRSHRRRVGRECGDARR